MQNFSNEQYGEVQNQEQQGDCQEQQFYSRTETMNELNPANNSPFYYEQPLQEQVAYSGNEQFAYEETGFDNQQTQMYYNEPTELSEEEEARRSRLWKRIRVIGIISLTFIIASSLYGVKVYQNFSTAGELQKTVDNDHRALQEAGTQLKKREQELKTLKSDLETYKSEQKASQENIAKYETLKDIRAFKYCVTGNDKPSSAGESDSNTIVAGEVRNNSKIINKGLVFSGDLSLLEESKEAEFQTALNDCKNDAKNLTFNEGGVAVETDVKSFQEAYNKNKQYFAEAKTVLADWDVYKVAESKEGYIIDEAGKKRLKPLAAKAMGVDQTTITDVSFYTVQQKTRERLNKIINKQVSFTPEKTLEFISKYESQVSSSVETKLQDVIKKIEEKKKEIANKETEIKASEKVVSEKEKAVLDQEKRLKDRKDNLWNPLK